MSLSWEVMEKMAESFHLDQASVRLVQDPPLYSSEPVNTPDAAVRVLSDAFRDFDREVFVVVNLRADLKPINVHVASMGTLDSAMVHPREVLKASILSNAAKVLLMHNHPSGNLQPSKEDVQITDRLSQVFSLMGIDLLDHIIIGNKDRYYSFLEKGELPLSSQHYTEDIEKLNIGKRESVLKKLKASRVAESAEKSAESVEKEKDAVREQEGIMQEKKADHHFLQKNSTGREGQNAAGSTRKYPTEREKMQQITTQLEEGVHKLLTSEQYEKYLKTMRTFRHYSFNNTILIAMQKPDATLVAGFDAWKQKKRFVKKGEKGIRIIAPVMVKEKKLKLQADGQPFLDENGKKVWEETGKTVQRFKVTSVFDISQTDGEPLPSLEVHELKGENHNYEKFMHAVEQISPVPIRFDEIEGEAKGYYAMGEKEIVIRSGMSEVQTMKTAVHELSHAFLHDWDRMTQEGNIKDMQTREVEAESVAYVVCQEYGLDTADYSFPYIASWSSGKDMKELKASMDTIRRTAGTLIDNIDVYLGKEVVERDEKDAFLDAEAKDSVPEQGWIQEGTDADNPFVDAPGTIAMDQKSGGDLMNERNNKESVLDALKQADGKNRTEKRAGHIPHEEKRRDAPVL